MQRTYTDIWNFREANTKEYTHVYHTYPAMMIPQIARKLLSDYKPQGRLELIFDPYMGSGTTLVESKILGVKSIGTDINPLARLIAKTKITNFDSDTITSVYEKTIAKIKDYKPNFDFNLPNITNCNFWYDQNRLSELVFLTNHINNLDNSVQDFFKLSLSECVREVSYTRNNEFKRYKMSADKIQQFNPNTFKLFLSKIERNLLGLKELNKKNCENNSLTYGFNSVEKIPNDIIENESVDMVITSPPYGDSKTTVAYGQFSRWANEWFNFENAKKLDTVLMGGRKLNTYSFSTEIIKENLEYIKKQDEKRYYEVLDFLEEYFMSMKNVAEKVRQGGRVCYVVGNRNVKGIQIDLDYFTVETFEKFGFRHINTFVREIPNKRMPSVTSPSNIKGNHVNTMSNEYIVILEKY